MLLRTVSIMLILSLLAASSSASVGEEHNRPFLKCERLRLKPLRRIDS